MPPVNVKGEKRNNGIKIISQNIVITQAIGVKITKIADNTQNIQPNPEKYASISTTKLTNKKGMLKNVTE